MEKVELVKMEAHAAAMKATNQTTQLPLAKMSQESKILMADMAKMTQPNEMYRERIGQEVLAARVPSASMIAPTPSTFMPPPTPEEPVPAMEVSPVLADDEDVTEVQPPMTPFI
jgi:hypothetical protein